MAEIHATAAESKFVLRVKKEVTGVRIEVEDNGPGMGDDTAKRIFEPFFTTKAVGVGTGLGLSVSYFIIVENHGGEMSVESHPGRYPLHRAGLHIPDGNADLLHLFL